MSAFDSKLSELEGRVLKVEELAKPLLADTNSIEIKEEKGILSGDVAILSAQKDNLSAENEKLRKEVDKLNYRVKHLIKALNEEEAKNNKGN
eukprot:gene2231-4331_t